VQENEWLNCIMRELPLHPLIPHTIPLADRPDPKDAQVLQEGLGGQFGEMRTMMQYFFSEYELSRRCNTLLRFIEIYSNRRNGTC
jgi:hypothetical protein